jgi:hypothetical protein
VPSGINVGRNGASRGGNLVDGPEIWVRLRIKGGVAVTRCDVNVVWNTHWVLTVQWPQLESELNSSDRVGVDSYPQTLINGIAVTTQ